MAADSKPSTWFPPGRTRRAGWWFFDTNSCNPFEWDARVYLHYFAELFFLWNMKIHLRLSYIRTNIRTYVRTYVRPYKRTNVTRRAEWLILGSKSNTVSEMYASGSLATYRDYFVENVNFWSSFIRSNFDLNLFSEIVFCSGEADERSSLPIGYS